MKRRDNHGDATMLAGFLGMITLALIALGTWGTVTIVSGVLLDGEEGKSDSRVDEECEEMFPASEPIGPGRAREAFPPIDGLGRGRGKDAITSPGPSEKVQPKRMG
jgi:hypothetical protein